MGRPTPPLLIISSIEDENPITIEIFMNPGVFYKKF
jgi:hypothetical protein